MERFRYVKNTQLSKLPKTPGVYVFSDGARPLYIGKASSIQARVKSHFTHPSSRDQLFLDKVARVGYQETPTAFDALILESELIKAEQPRYNVMWRDDKHYFSVGITKEDFPRVFITHQPRLAIGNWQLAKTKNRPLEAKSKSPIANRQSADYIGPFVDGRALKRVLRLLRGVFPYYTARRHPRLPCSYCQLGLCPGPDPDKKAYAKSIRNLKAVLLGKKRAVLSKIERDMRRAAKEERFERASVLREQARSLEIVLSHASLLAPELPGTPAFGLEERLQHLLETPEPVVRAEAYDISNIQGQEATGSQVVFFRGRPAKKWYRKYKMRQAGKPNDFAMMEELVSRRLKHPEWPYPDLMVIDGGKGQLTAALQALRAAKVELPVAALAKKHNEVFVAGRRNPILLERESPQVRNFFLHIRDEAHRFAVSYHRKLMGKRS